MEECLHCYTTNWLGDGAHTELVKGAVRFERDSDSEEMYLYAVHQVIESPVEEHSKKPEETRRRIVELLGDVPRIELFARQRSPGWDVWGNEIGEQDEK